MKMNKILKQQLDKLNISYNEEDTQINIPKKEGFYLEMNRLYIIKLSDFMLNPPSGSTLVANWNNNSIPKQRYYKIDVDKIMNDMVKINGIGYDYVNKVVLNDMWSGWVPKSEMEILERI